MFDYIPFEKEVEYVLKDITMLELRLGNPTLELFPLWILATAIIQDEY